MFSVNIRRLPGCNSGKVFILIWQLGIDSRPDDLGVEEEMAYFGRVSYKQTAVLAQLRAIFLVVVCVWQPRNATLKQCGNREWNPPIIS